MRATGDLASPQPGYKKGAKMKRYLVVILALAFLLGPTVMAFADSPWTLADEKYTIVNTTSATKVTTLPTTVFRAGKDRVFRLSVTNSGLAPTAATYSDNFAAIYDCAALGSTSSFALVSSLEGEIEASGDETVNLEWKRPLKIYNGVTILQGAYTTVTVEWEKVNP